MRRWAMGTVAAIAAAVLVPWPWVVLPAIVAAWAGGRWALLLADYVARHWFMHHVSLMDLLHPPDDTGLELVRLAFQELVKEDAANRARNAAVVAACPGCTRGAEATTQVVH